MSGCRVMRKFRVRQDRGKSWDNTFPSPIFIFEAAFFGKVLAQSWKRSSKFVQKMVSCDNLGKGKSPSRPGWYGHALFVLGICWQVRILPLAVNTSD
jgi:hypothetical protein